MNSERKLYRSKKHSMIAGVCGGLGLYFGIDPTIVRVFFVLFTLVEGFGILLYILLALFMPIAPPEIDSTFDGRSSFELDNKQVANALGIGLVVLGGIVLLDNLNFAWLSWVSLGTIAPAGLIVLGVLLLMRRPDTHI